MRIAGEIRCLACAVHGVTGVMLLWGALARWRSQAASDCGSAVRRAPSTATPDDLTSGGSSISVNGGSPLEWRDDRLGVRILYNTPQLTLIGEERLHSAIILRFAAQCNPADQVVWSIEMPSTQMTLGEYSAACVTRLRGVVQIRREFLLDGSPVVEYAYSDNPMDLVRVLMMCGVAGDVPYCIQVRFRGEAKSGLTRLLQALSYSIQRFPKKSSESLCICCEPRHGVGVRMPMTASLMPYIDADDDFTPIPLGSPYATLKDGHVTYFLSLDGQRRGRHVALQSAIQWVCSHLNQFFMPICQSKGLHGSPTVITPGVLNLCDFLQSISVAGDVSSEVSEDNGVFRKVKGLRGSCECVSTSETSYSLSVEALEIGSEILVLASVTTGIRGEGENYFLSSGVSLGNHFGHEAMLIYHCRAPASPKAFALALPPMATVHEPVSSEPLCIVEARSHISPKFSVAACIAFRATKLRLEGSLSARERAILSWLCGKGNVDVHRSTVVASSARTVVMEIRIELKAGVSSGRFSEGNSERSGATLWTPCISTDGKVEPPDDEVTINTVCIVSAFDNIVFLATRRLFPGETWESAMSSLNSVKLVVGSD